MPTSIIIKIPTGELKGKKWLMGSGGFRMILGMHEKENARFLLTLVQKGQVFYDIGAHVGYYSLLSSQLLGESGKVVAFEPNPRNLKLLRKNLNLNNIKNVQVISACVGDKMETVGFDSNDDSSTGHIGGNGKLNVDMVRLDTLVNTNLIPPPNFLKIDVEGAEMLVLNGAKNILNKHHPKLLLSTHGPIIHAQCVKFLKTQGYKLLASDREDTYFSHELLAY